MFREEYGRAVAVLVRQFGDIGVAEDMVQEAFTVATEHWPKGGPPPSPAGWIIATARHRGIDRFRREASRQDRHLEAARQAALRRSDEDSEIDPLDPRAEDVMGDDRLRLIFTCCHPALAPHAQVALTLRLLGGLTTAEIGRAFLVPEATMAQRLVRAKGKIRDARIPYRIPDESDLPTRLRSVLSVIYLIFNEGYAATSGDRLVREDLCAEAVRLARFVATLVRQEPEVLGLLALLLLIESRRVTRTTPDGDLVLLAEQDRRVWDRALIAEGQDLVRRCLASNRPGPYQIQAAIQAVHCDAPIASETDWPQVLRLYDQLLVLAPNPIVVLNRAVAVAEIEGPEAALALLVELETPLEDYHPFHVVRAELLRRAGRAADAALAYEAAIARAENSRERAFLESRRRAL